MAIRLYLSLMRTWDRLKESFTGGGGGTWNWFWPPVDTDVLAAFVIIAPLVAGFFYISLRASAVFSASHLTVADLSLSQIVRLIIAACVGLFIAGMLGLYSILAGDSLLGEKQPAEKPLKLAAFMFLATALATAAYVLGFEIAFNLRLRQTSSPLEALIYAFYSWGWLLMALSAEVQQWIRSHWDRPIKAALRGLSRIMM